MSKRTTIILSFIVLAAMAFAIAVADQAPQLWGKSREATKSGDKLYCHLRSSEAALADPLGEECVNELY